MRTILLCILCVAVLLKSFALHVHAGEPEENTITVRGLVVSSGHDLIINDGVRDYLLLGVDTQDTEGTICEATGNLTITGEIQIIEVTTIHIIAKEYPDEDLVGENQDLGNPGWMLYWPYIQAIASVSPGVVIVGQHALSLPIWDGSGMRELGDATNVSRTACRFQYFSTIRKT